MSIPLLVADDRELIRAGLREFVRGTDLAIVAEASIQDASNLLNKHPDIQLLILGMEPPGTLSLALLDRLKTSRERLHVLLYAARTSAETIASRTSPGRLFI